MKKEAFSTFVLVSLLAVLAISTASAHVTMHLVPQDSSMSEGYCHTVYVEVWADIDADDTLLSGQFHIHSDGSCINITGVSWGPNILPAWSSWNPAYECWGPDHDAIWFTFGVAQTNTDQMICNITVHCKSIEYCNSIFNFSCGKGGCYPLCPIEILDEDDVELYPDNVTLINGTFKFEGKQETFSKALYAGWNLVSLPLVPDDNGTSSVLASVCENVTAVFSYDTASKQFENVTDTTMDPGTGYFVHVTESCTWNYNGYAYISINTQLEQGLNMIGWLNCTKEISDALSSIHGDYYYAAKWDAVEQKFETYNPAAPNGFNDFFDMDRGTGYFISAKSDVTLSESCVA